VDKLQMYGYVMIYLNQEIGVQEIVQQLKQKHKHKPLSQTLLKQNKQLGMIYLMRIKQHQMEDQQR